MAMLGDWDPSRRFPTCFLLVSTTLAMSIRGQYPSSKHCNLSDQMFATIHRIGITSVSEDLRWPYPLWPSSRHDFELYILIAYSSAELLQSFLSSRRLFKPRSGTNPLVYAADLRKTGHAMVLLAFGADVNMGGLAIDDSHRTLPLAVSIDRSEDVLVGELLQRGCPVSSKLLATTVCLPWCSARVLVKLMQTDEFVEWAHEIGDEKLYRGVGGRMRRTAGKQTKTMLR